MTRAGTIRVLVVDDSAIVRKILTETLSQEPDIEVVGTAPDPFVARDKILSSNPDVITLDIEMPRMDGLTFLKKLMKYRPLPVVVISSLGQASCQTALDALSYGAVEVLAKPGGPYSVGSLQNRLAATIRAAAAARAPGTVSGAPPMRQQPVVASGPFPLGTLIAMGASTGGTEALKEVLAQMPAGSPPIAIAQHIPPVFSRAFAERLNGLCRIEVREATTGDRLVPGLALVAPGNLHMIVRRDGAYYKVEVKDGPPVCYQRPSVDVLFRSAAEAAAERGIGVLLTGMGSDGAQGLLAMRRAGGRTVAQDEATCAIFGMPRKAIELGAACQVLPLGRIAAAVVADAETARPPAV